LLAGPYVACGLACVRKESTSAWRKPALCAVVIALCGLGAIAGQRTGNIVDHQRPTAADVRMMKRLPLSGEDVVLTNAYTEGYLDVLTKGRGLLEGRAPYTFPRVLKRANRLLRMTRNYYRDPSGHASFLRRHKVTYVLLGRPGSYALGTGNLVAKTPPTKLDHSCCLSRVLYTRDLAVYRVDGDALPRS
jgi:hypothetical protein